MLSTKMLRILLRKLDKQVIVTLHVPFRFKFDYYKVSIIAVSPAAQANVGRLLGMQLLVIDP